MIKEGLVAPRLDAELNVDAIVVEGAARHGESPHPTTHEGELEKDALCHERVATIRHRSPLIGAYVGLVGDSDCSVALNRRRARGELMTFDDA